MNSPLLLRQSRYLSYKSNGSTNAHFNTRQQPKRRQKVPVPDGWAYLISCQERIGQVSKISLCHLLLHWFVSEYTGFINTEQTKKKSFCLVFTEKKNTKVLDCKEKLTQSVFNLMQSFGIVSSSNFVTILLSGSANSSDFLFIAGITPSVNRVKGGAAGYRSFLSTADTRLLLVLKPLGCYTYIYTQMLVSSNPQNKETPHQYSTCCKYYQTHKSLVKHVSLDSDIT